MNIRLNRDNSSLHYFLVGKYESAGGTITDFTCAPRPFNSLALIINGGAVFQSANERVKVKSGDMIFIPQGCTYKSTWSLFPISTYITLHFNFGVPTFLFNRGKYSLQKIELIDFELYKKDFEYVYQHSKDNDFSLYGAMSKFYIICYEIFPKLIADGKKALSASINLATDFIENNYFLDFNVGDLAKKSMMSQSNFYMAFKKETGFTPTDYKNFCRIKEAIRLLSIGTYSIEELTTLLGYNSSTYFRRVFKKLTSKSPKDFKSGNYIL